MDDELQLASAWLPGRIAQSHTQVIARHLIKAVASLARSCGLVSNGAAELTTQLGETRSLNYRNQFGLVWFGRACFGQGSGPDQAPLDRLALRIPLTEDFFEEQSSTWPLFVWSSNRHGSNAELLGRTGQ